MRSSFDLKTLRVPKEDIAVSQRILETYQPSASLRSEAHPEIPAEELLELRNELIKLRSTLINVITNFEKQVIPLNTRIANFELSTAQSLQQIQSQTHAKTSQPPAQKANPIRNAKLKNKINSTPQFPPNTQFPQFFQPPFNPAPAPPPKEKIRGSERSVRSHSDREKEQQITGNPLDIWVRSEPMFAPLPSQEDVASVFSQIIEKSIKGATMSFENPQTPIPHWSETLLENMQKFTTKESKRMPKLLPPPGPPPAPDDIADYWKHHTPSFPIQNMQKRNSHTIHHLLAAIVETDPSKMPQRSLTEKRKPYLPINVLAPKLEHERYLCLDFDERLNLELKSVGLDLSQSVKMNDDDTFAEEIAKYKQQLLQLIPEVQKSSKMLIDKIPTFRKIEDQHFIEQAMYQELSQIVQRKHRKK